MDEWIIEWIIKEFLFVILVFRITRVSLGFSVFMIISGLLSKGKDRR